MSQPFHRPRGRDRVSGRSFGYAETRGLTVDCSGSGTARALHTSPAVTSLTYQITDDKLLRLRSRGPKKNGRVHARGKYARAVELRAVVESAAGPSAGRGDSCRDGGMGAHVVLRHARTARLLHDEE